MKTHIVFWVAVIILIIIICILLYKNGYIKYIESMRTVPRPMIHPDDKYTPPPGAAAQINIKPGGLNEDVDDFIGQYFDKNQIPYTNTISLYSKYFVNKGNLDPELKLKLRDICYYFIEVAIPNIPSVDNPKPEIKWPRIEWLSDNWDAYNYSFNEDAINNLNLLNRLYKKYGGGGGGSESKGRDGTNGIDGSNGDSSTNPNKLTDSKSEGSNLGYGSSKKAGGTSTCNTNCPIECNAFTKCPPSSKSSSLSPATLSEQAKNADSSNWWDVKNKDYYGSGKNGQNGIAGLPGTFGSGKYINGKSSGSNELHQVLITNAPNEYPDSMELNNYIKNKIIDVWFDTTSDAIRPMPSKYAQNMFDLYIEGRSPIDRNHKNKLRDLVYYFMENIIPGLPTAEKSVSYVEWKPLRYLSNSDL